MVGFPPFDGADHEGMPEREPRENAPPRRVRERHCLLRAKGRDARFLIEIGAADHARAHDDASDRADEPRVADLLRDAGDERADIDLPRRAATTAARLLLTRSGEEIDLDHERRWLGEAVAIR